MYESWDSPPIILAHRFIILDTDPKSSSKLSLTNKPNSTTLVQSRLCWFHFAAWSNRDVHCRFRSRFCWRGRKAPHLMSLLVSQHRVFEIKTIRASCKNKWVIDWSPVRCAYASSLSSNFSTCDTSESWPVNDVEGFVSTTYDRQRQHMHKQLLCQNSHGKYLDCLEISNAVEPKRLGVIIQLRDDLWIAIAIVQWYFLIRNRDACDEL